MKRQICGWYLSYRPFARLAFNFNLGTNPDVCSGMNTEQPAAVRSYIRWAAAIFVKQVFQARDIRRGRCNNSFKLIKTIPFYRIILIRDDHFLHYLTEVATTIENGE